MCEVSLGDDILQLNKDALKTFEQHNLVNFTEYYSLASGGIEKESIDIFQKKGPGDKHGSGPTPQLVVRDVAVTCRLECQAQTDSLSPGQVNGQQFELSTRILSSRTVLGP